MADVTQYIGARYVPIFGRIGEDSIEWDNSKEYEPLTIVSHAGNSYTSRQYVPIGIDISNNAFWALTGNYNAQVEQYRKEVATFADRITTNETNMRKIMPFDETPTEDSAKGVTSDGIKKAIDTAEQTNADAIANEVTRAKGAEQANADAIANEVTRAKGAEQANADAIANEVTRAKGAEQANADAIANEVTRAKGAEQANADAIAIEVTRATNAEKTNADAIQNAVQNAVNTTAFPNTTYIIANRNPSIEGAVDFWFTDDFKWYYPLSLGNKLFEYPCDLLYINKVNDFYYLWTNSEYAVSKDFKNWTTYEEDIGHYKQNIGHRVSVWGACFVPDSNYIIGSRKYIDTQTATNPFGETHFFVPFYVTYSQNEATGELTFSDASNIIPPNFTLNVSSYIDPSIVKIGNTYYIVFKNELTAKAVLYTATDIINTSTWSSVNFDCPLYGYEAPKLIVDSSDNTINMLVSYYNMNGYILQQFTDKKTEPTTTFVNEPVLFLNVFNNPSTRYVLMSKYNGAMGCRHCAPYKVDAKIARAFIFNKIPYQRRLRSVTLNTSKYTGVYIPGTQWIQSGPNQGILEFSDSKIFIDDLDDYGTIYSNTASKDASLTLSGSGRFNADWKSKQILSFGTDYIPYTIKPGQSLMITTAIRDIVQPIGAC